MQDVSQPFPIVVGDVAAESWQYLMWGIWESGLRIDELMHVSWDDANQIRPVWQRGRLPVLAIPHERQKNVTEESIPLLPGFESLLLQTPEQSRAGWVFNPKSLQMRCGRKPRHQRPQSEWAGKVVSRIGEAAGVIVNPKSGERDTKYASSHGLRRSLAERLYDAGVPEREVSRIMRHADAQTTQRHYVCAGECSKVGWALAKKTQSI